MTARAAWETAAPVLRELSALSGRALGYLATLALRHRVPIFRLSHRVMWWGALALMLVAGRALLGGLGDGVPMDSTHLYFGAGLALCCVVLVFAAERRMRVAAFLLGSGHGAIALLAWLVTQS